MTTTTSTVTVTELAFQAGSSDKFYRTFAWGTPDAGYAVIQYGRAGTTGTTKGTTYPTLEAAEAFAAKQVQAKTAKGYQLVGGAAFTVAFAPDQVAAAADLDGLANRNITADGGNITDAAAATDQATATAADKVAGLLHGTGATVTLDTIVTALADAGHHPDPALPSTIDFAPIPQLAEALTDHDLDLALDDRNLVGQPKMDGDRFMVMVRSGEVTVLNRAGMAKTTNIVRDALVPFQALTQGDWVFDGEVVGRTLHLFDMAFATGYITADTPFSGRFAVLTVIVGALGSSSVQLVATSGPTGSEKRAMLDQIGAERGEGIILRGRTARYRPGIRGEGLSKWKFVNEADCYVASVDPTGKSSVTLAVKDRNGNEAIVGKASTIGKDRTIGVGTVVEVRFMYCLDTAAPVMVQPRIVRVRTAKTADACSIDQFATAGTSRSRPAA